MKFEIRVRLAFLQKPLAPFFASSTLLLAFFLIGFSAASAKAQLNVDARVGFGQNAPNVSRYRPDTWTPVTVYLTGQASRGTGQLNVTVHQGQRNTTYSRRIALNDGPLNEAYSFAFDYPPSSYAFSMGGMNSGSPDIIVQLVVDGRELAKRKFAMPVSLPSETFNLLALTRDGSGMNFLVKKKLGLVHKGVSEGAVAQRYGGMTRGNQASAQNSKSQIPPIELLYTDPHALPELTQGYKMMDAVALGDQPLDNLKEDQIEALKGYVREGGLLVVSGGGDLSRLKSQFYKDMLPVDPTSAVNVKNSSELAELQKRYQQTLTIPSGTALTVGTLKPNSEILLGSSKGATGYGLVASRPYGSGVVIFTAFDFLAPEFRGWSQAPSLWRDLLRSGNTAVSPRNVLTLASSNRMNGNALGLEDALAGKQAASIPPFGLVAGFLGAYILLLVPVSYLILKKLDKREFSWVTSPILILGFTVASYCIALSIKGGALTVNRAVIVEGLANSSQYAGEGQMTLYSPRRADYTIAFAPPGDLAKPFRLLVPSETYPPNEAAVTELHVEHDLTSTIKNANIALWDKRSFATPISADLGGPVLVKTEMANENSARIVITNRTKFVLNDCAVINADNQVTTIGKLAPGQTWKSPSVMKWTFKGTGTSVHVPQITSNSAIEIAKKTETPQELRTHIRRRLTEALNNAPNQSGDNPYGGVETSSYGHVSNAFVGWIDNSSDPLLKVQVDGKSAAGEEVAMLYIHLPAPPNASSIVRGVTNAFQLEPDLNIQSELPTNRGAAMPGGASGE